MCRLCDPLWDNGSSRTVFYKQVCAVALYASLAATFSTILEAANGIPTQTNCILPEIGTFIKCPLGLLSETTPSYVGLEGFLTTSLSVFFVCLQHDKYEIYRSKICSCGEMRSSMKALLAGVLGKWYSS